MPQCPHCDHASMLEIEYEDDYLHNGKLVRVSMLEYWKCPKCGKEMIDERQIQRNQARIYYCKQLSESEDT